jgi:hypothetical protein
MHALMNAAFIVHRQLFFTAAVLTVGGSAWRPRTRGWFVGLAMVHGVGIILVGVALAEQVARYESSTENSRSASRNRTAQRALVLE